MTQKPAAMAPHTAPFKTVLYDQVDITVGAETGGNTINVAIQLKSGTKELAQRAKLEFYLSDDANGDSLAATAPSSGFAIGTDGVILTEHTANKHATAISEADGDIDINIVEASADTWYLVCILPSGELVVSDPITFA